MTHDLEALRQWSARVLTDVDSPYLTVSAEMFRWQSEALAELEARLRSRQPAEEALALAHYELDALRARLAECERDAARYRWLRNHIDSDCEEYPSPYTEAEDGADFDKRIDACLAQGKRREG